MRIPLRALLFAVLLVVILVGTAVYLIENPPQKPATLSTGVGVSDIPGDSPDNIAPQLYNHLYITGTVKNTGTKTAYNAGLHVTAYAADNTLEINMTIPLAGGKAAAVFGTNSQTQIYGNNSLALGSLAGGETANINLGIFHEGTVVRWTVEAVWTDTP